MDISRLVFSNETKNKMKEELSDAQKGKLRWERVKESENKGNLALAKNRYEVANIAGFSEEERDRGYQWVSNMVYRGHLKEIMHGIGKNGKIEYEYHISGEPDYLRKNARAAKKAKREKALEVTTEKQAPSVRDRGKKLFDKLNELEKNGMLAKAKTRADIATLVGYTDDQRKAGYSWVSNMVRRGYLKEEIVGTTPSGIAVVKYSLSGLKPMYNYEEVRKKKDEKEERKENWANENMPAPEEKEVVNSDVIKINITRGDININVEVVNSDQAIKLITTILKGE